MRRDTAGCLCWTIPKQSAQLDQYAVVTSLLRCAIQDRPMTGRLVPINPQKLAETSPMTHHDGLKNVAVKSGCTLRRMQLVRETQQYNNIQTHCKSGIVETFCSNWSPQTEKPTGHERCQRGPGVPKIQTPCSTMGSEASPRHTMASGSWILATASITSGFSRGAKGWKSGGTRRSAKTQKSH